MRTSDWLALYGLDWYKNRKQNRKVEEEVEDYNNTKEPLAERLAYLVPTINNNHVL